MPITKSAKKAIRQNQRHQARNLVRKRTYKNVVKEYRKAVTRGQGEEAKALLPRIYKALDKAAKTGVIHQNKAARLKSRLSQLIAKARSASS